MKFQIPNQSKSKIRAKPEHDALVREFAKFPMREDETFAQAMDRFERERKKAIPAKMREELIAMEQEHQRLETLRLLVEKAEHLEMFMFAWTRYSSNKDLVRDVGALRTLLVCWASMRCDRFYEVSRGLAERMAFTELRGVTCDRLRLPFRRVCFDVPATFSLGVKEFETAKKIYIEEEETAWSKLPQRSDDSESKEIAQPYHIGHSDGTPCTCANSFSQEDLREFYRFNRSWLIAISPAELHKGHRDDPRVMVLRVMLRDDMKFSEAMENSLRVRYQVAPDVPVECMDEIYRMIGGNEVARKILQLIANLVLFSSHHATRATATNPEWVSLGERIEKLPPGPKKERLKERRRSLDPNYKIILGAGIRPIPAEALEGNSISVRTLVAGHWRNQVYGPRQRINLESGELEAIPSSERLHEEIWIQPHWRGLENEEESMPIRVMR